MPLYWLSCLYSLETILRPWSPGASVPLWRLSSRWSSSLRWSSSSLSSLVKLLQSPKKLLDTDALRSIFLFWNPTPRLLHILGTAPGHQAEELLLHVLPLPPHPLLQGQREVAVWLPNTGITVKRRSSREVWAVVLALTLLFLPLPPAQSLLCSRTNFLPPQQTAAQAVVLPRTGRHQWSASLTLPPRCL